MSDVVSREEHRELQRRVGGLEGARAEMIEILHEIDKRTAIMHAAIMGGPGAGVTGLVGKVNKVQTWIAEHGPADNLQEHVIQTVDTPKERKVNGWAIFAACIGAAGMIGSLIRAVLK